MVRKPSKLPGKIISVDYGIFKNYFQDFMFLIHSYVGLEYGKNTLCLQEESTKPKLNVLIVDDLLATGRTVEASAKLIQQLVPYFHFFSPTDCNDCSARTSCRCSLFNRIRWTRWLQEII